VDEGGIKKRHGSATLMFLGYDPSKFLNFPANALYKGSG